MLTPQQKQELEALRDELTALANKHTKDSDQVDIDTSHGHEESIELLALADAYAHSASKLTDYITKNS